MKTMNKGAYRSCFLLLLTGFLLSLWSCQTVVEPPYVYKDTLAWSDEFDGETVDASNWAFETGSGGWGNNELQYYTNRPENAMIENGSLVITAKEESLGGAKYTSARMVTRGKHSWKYGKIEARIKLPYGQGIWPAFWMLGTNFSSAGWPKCGEIDIIEMVGGGENRDDTVHGTAHWDSNGHAEYGGSKALPDPSRFCDDYHKFGIKWNKKQIVWYLDDVQYMIIDITPAGLSEFRAPFFIIINLAVGGNWPGAPDKTTVFPQKMYVDWIRVYQ
jgi:beta-glucanase (GH16 family)